jgi:hypothetical protein
MNDNVYEHNKNWHTLFLLYFYEYEPKLKYAGEKSSTKFEVRNFEDCDKKIKLFVFFHILVIFQWYSKELRCNECNSKQEWPLFLK